jgi:hypothetical protein
MAQLLCDCQLPAQDASIVSAVMVHPLALLLFVSFVADCFCPEETTDDKIRMCPAVPDFTQFFAQVPNLGRRLRVASPCMGVHACGHALECMGVPSDTINAFDLEEGYQATLVNLLEKAGQQIIRLHLGKAAGNILNYGLRELESPVDFVISGPPCPPWAGQGSKKGAL